jgi:hypothetical protein
MTGDVLRTRAITSNEPIAVVSQLSPLNLPAGTEKERVYIGLRRADCLFLSVHPLTYYYTRKRARAVCCCALLLGIRHGLRIFEAV